MSELLKFIVTSERCIAILREEERDIIYELRDVERENRDVEFQIRRADKEQKAELKAKQKTVRKAKESLA